MTDTIIGLITTMVFSAFFSGMEIAFVSGNRMLAEVERGKNGISQRAISYFYRHPNNLTCMPANRCEPAIQTPRAPVLPPIGNLP